MLGRHNEDVKANGSEFFEVAGQWKRKLTDSSNPQLRGGPINTKRDQRENLTIKRIHKENLIKLSGGHQRNGTYETGNQGWSCRTSNSNVAGSRRFRRSGCHQRQPRFAHLQCKEHSSL